MDCHLTDEAHNALIDSDGECRCGETRRVASTVFRPQDALWDAVPA